VRIRAQFARAERLRNIVVGAEFESHDTIGLLVHAGEHDDRNRSLLAQAARDRHAVLAREAQIENDEIDRLGFQCA
jgi:hypothetical protein